MEIRVNDSVIAYKEIPVGRQLRFGTVLALNAQAGTARVHFPLEFRNEDIPVGQLERTEARYGGTLLQQPNIQ